MAAATGAALPMLRDGALWHCQCARQQDGREPTRNFHRHRISPPLSPRPPCTSSNRAKHRPFTGTDADRAVVIEHEHLARFPLAAIPDAAARNPRMRQYGAAQFEAL
jgi:hypothetical protein